MRPSLAITDSPDSRRMNRLQALLEVCLLSGVISGFLAGIPFSLDTKDGISVLTAGRVVGALLLETCITLILLAMVLRLRGESLRDLGLDRRHWIQNIALGLVLVPLLFLVNILISIGFRLFLPRYHMLRNPLIDLVRTPTHLALFLLSSWIAGGFKEELQRAFILMRFGEHLGGFKVGLVVWSLAFGAQHYLQGVQGMVTASLFGFAFGLLYLLRGSVVGPIFAHGMYDTAALLFSWFARG